MSFTQRRHRRRGEDRIADAFELKNEKALRLGALEAVLSARRQTPASFIKGEDFLCNAGLIFL